MVDKLNETPEQRDARQAAEVERAKEGVVVPPESLASSAPDINHMFMGQVNVLLKLNRWWSTFMAGWLMNVWTICVIGVPAMLSGAVLVDKYQQGAAARREFDLKMFELQTDVDLKKLSLTSTSVAGSGELTKSIQLIGDKIDKQVIPAITELQANVSDLRKEQSDSRIRIRALAAESRERATKLREDLKSQRTESSKETPQ